MTEPGPLLASGRAADVFDLGDGTVLRRYRTDHPIDHELRVMRFLHESSYPVPRVHDGAGRDLVMDLIQGPTMLDDISRRPWRLDAHTKTLADLQIRLAGLEAPPWVPGASGIPDGSAILHMDLHPMNVIISPTGPVVIDWTNTRRGHGDFDAGMTYILAAAFEPASRFEQVAARLLLRRFRHHRGAAAIGRWWTQAIDYRSCDANVTAGEMANLETLRRAGPPS